MCVLERNDWLGGAIRTAEITEPGFVHEVFASWHPLFTGSAAYAELEGRPRGARARVPEHRPADGDALPRRRERVPHDVARAERRCARAGAGSAQSRSSCRTPTSPSASSRPSCGRATAPRSAWKALRRLGRRGLVEFTGNVLVSCRDWLTETFERRACARPARAVGAAHGPRPGRGVVGIHGAGDRRRDRARRDARAARRRREARRGAGGDRPRRGRRPARPGATSSASSSPAAARPACGPRTARRSRPRAPCSRT